MSTLIQPSFQRRKKGDAEKKKGVLDNEEWYLSRKKGGKGAENVIIIE